MAGATPIAAFAAQVGAPLTEVVRARIDDQTRNAAYKIVSGKGSTYYGIAAGLARIVGAIRQDEQAVLSVSTVTADVEGVRDVALSVPRVVGREEVSPICSPIWIPGNTRPCIEVRRFCAGFLNPSHFDAGSGPAKRRRHLWRHP